MNITAIIPARGGSKGIPGKNIRAFGGKPLLAWSIERARQTPQISGVFVSTDSNEIAEVAREYGAEVIMRPAEISGDTASSESCLVHALDWLQSAKREAQSAGGKAQDALPASPLAPGASGSPLPALPLALSSSRFPLPASPSPSDLCDPDLVVFLQATSPLREPDDIQKAIETLVHENADSLFSACRLEGFVWRVELDGRVRSFTYDHLNRPRRQDAPEDLIENGSIYIFKPWVLRQFNNRLGGKVAVYRMPALHSFQIDEPADLELVEAVMEFRKAQSKTESRKQKAEIGQDSLSAFRFPLPASPLAADLRPPTSDLSKIKLLVLDFDGVLTDNRVMVTEDGKEAVICSREDGLGLERLTGNGIEVIVISKEKNPVVAARCRKLGIECVQGEDDKLGALKRKAQSAKRTCLRPTSAQQEAEIGILKPEEIAYVGNDVNDLECLRWVGLPIAVADAMPEVIAVAKWVTTKPGGHGAVREVCEALRAAKREAQSAKGEARGAEGQAPSA